MASVSHPPAAHSRKIAIALAFAGALFNPIPLVWLHKFYLGQYLWGIVYLVLAPTRIPQIACCFEGIWYLTQSNESFCSKFSHSSAFVLSEGENATTQTHQDVSQTAASIREIEQLRQEGLMTEYEFEQKRRKLLDQV